jgi:dTMP kinase
MLVAIEGIDGAGKTTQVARLRERFVGRGWDVVTSKEPTDGPWGRRIRESAKAGRMAPADELHAFLEDRREHVASTIRPALNRGALVLLDRYYFSTIAYQGLKGGDPESIRQANEEFAPVPDLLVVLDLDPEDALRRIEERGDEANHFERVHLLEESREIFWRYVHPEPRIAADGRRCWRAKVDANQPADMVTKIIESTIIVIATDAIAQRRDLSGAEQMEATLRTLGAATTA